MCICDYVKNCIGTCEKCIFQFEKGYKWIIALGSPKTPPVVASGYGQEFAMISFKTVKRIEVSQ